MSAVLVVQDEMVTENPGPREGGPRRRRAFTVREKLDHLTAYESACAAGGGAVRDRPTDQGTGVDPPQTGENRSSTGHYGKSTRALGGNLRERGHRKEAGATLTGCYDELVDAGVRTRFAATLTGLSKATQDRRRRAPVHVIPGEPGARPVPVNKLTDTEAAELIAVLNSQRFVDKAPPQI